MLRMYDVIQKKQSGKPLNKAEINFFVKGLTDGSIPDYQVSALLMAIYFVGMNDTETINLTESMLKSGKTVDLSSIYKSKVDKHSTGGVGDKTTLIVAPMVAAANLGVCVPKMSGKGLGHTGGTIDKLHSIPGVDTDKSPEEFVSITNEIGLCVIGQSDALVPADKIMYALRDVTATVDCIPLIASSIMSKKLASGSDCFVLDVKCGSGAFFKTRKEAETAALLMVKIGNSFGKKTIALITNMDSPLGHNIGNSLEIIEACEVLDGEGDEELTELCVTLAANMIYAATGLPYDECKNAVAKTLTDNSAKQKLESMVKALGGNPEYINNPALFEESKVSAVLAGEKSGYINRIDTEAVGVAAGVLGAGRVSIDDDIDYSAGVVLHKKVGEPIQEGEALATIYTSSIEKAQKGMEILFKSILITEKPPQNRKTIYKTIGGCR